MNNLIEKVSKRYAEYTALVGLPNNSKCDNSFAFYCAITRIRFRDFCEKYLGKQWRGNESGEDLYKRLTYKNVIEETDLDPIIDNYSDCYSSDAERNLYKENLLKMYEENCQEELVRKPFSKKEAEILSQFEDYLIKEHRYRDLVELMVTFKNVNVEKIADVLVNCWEEISSEYDGYIKYIPTQAKERLFTKLKEKGENINI